MHMTNLETSKPELLVTQARQGNVGALGELLDLYRNYLSILAQSHVDRKLQAKVDPSDLVQETLLQAHRDFPQFLGTTEAELMKWLRAIMATKGAKMQRHYLGTQRRDIQLERELQDNIDRSSIAMNNVPVSQELSPSQKAARRESAIALADALAQLSKNCRDVIVLHHIEGLAISEIARRMDTTAARVRKQWADAVIELRTLMRGYV